MDEKRERQAAVRRIVRGGLVRTQAAVRQALRGRGWVVDQSTLSRDLVELGIRKSGGRYILQPATGPRDEALDLSAAVLATTTCGPHLIVIRTTVGQAQGVAISIDSRQEPSIIATIAGDDAILVTTKNRRTQTVALRRLEQWFGDKHER